MAQFCGTGGVTTTGPGAGTSRSMITGVAARASAARASLLARTASACDRAASARAISTLAWAPATWPWI